MRHYTHILPFVLFASLAAPNIGYALWGLFPNDEPAKAPAWPQEIVKAINNYNRVYGHGAYDRGWSFYFAGKAASLNTFLAAVSKAKCRDRRFEIVPGRGIAQARPSLPSFDEREDSEIAFNWVLHLEVVIPFDEALTDEDGNTIYIQRIGGIDHDKTLVPGQTSNDQYEYDVKVSAYTENIDIERLQLPITYQARIGGSVVDLINAHNRRRKDSIANGDDLELAEPTTMADVATGDRQQV